MMHTIFVQPQARLDVLDTYAFIGQGSPRTADRFVAAVEQVFIEIARAPLSGHLRDEITSPRLAGIRSRKVRGFPKHLVFYLTEAKAIRVLRVLHGARDIPAALGDEQ